MLMRPILTLILTTVLLLFFTTSLHAEFLVGTSTADITPEGPVALSGQFHLRIANQADTPLTANVIAIESTSESRASDFAVMVSCDLLYIPNEVLISVREEVSQRLPELDVSKIFLNGTHTHTAPVLIDDKYKIPSEGVIQPSEYRAFLAERIAEAIDDAWNNRSPGSVSWGLSHATVGYSRRAVYADGSARMYGPTDTTDFRHMEGSEDHDVNTLFFWDAEGELSGMVVNVSCPSQEVESGRNVHADFWHPTRKLLRERYGEHFDADSILEGDAALNARTNMNDDVGIKEICVVGWTGASGDQSPHVKYREEAEDRMRRLRGLSNIDEIARRIVRAVDDAYPIVVNDQHEDPVLKHKVETLALPMRLVTEAEYAEAQAEVARAANAIEADPNAANSQHRRMRWYQVTVDRYELQQTDPAPTYEMELHVLRIGDAVICTNPFEMFTDYGIRMKGRSRAVQTFVVQLTGPGTYLPTETGVQGGHYSAVVHSSLVGPEGGQVLVDRTVEVIESLFADE
jgi:hypothetical protein